MQTLRYAVVRCSVRLRGWHAGIDPASPAVVEASVQIYLSVHPFLSRSGYRQESVRWQHFSRALTSTVMSSGQSSLSCLWPLFGGHLQELDLTRADLRRGNQDTRIYIGRVYDRWCAAREEAERGKKMLGTSAEQDDKKHVQLLSLELAFATNSKVVHHRPSTLTPVPAGRVARSRCSDFYQAGAAIGLIWCSLGGIGAIFLSQKNRQKITE